MIRVKLSFVGGTCLDIIDDNHGSVGSLLEYWIKSNSEWQTYVHAQTGIAKSFRFALLTSIEQYA